jgi:DNA invertase Pin-like site-specific DNA recombinase
MLLGYARVSTDQLDHALQLDALHAAGCDKLFVETASGTRTDRPELAKALAQARQGDVLVVRRLDRLARSLRHLIDIADDLNRRGVALKSITESIDTPTPSGRFMFKIFGALSSMERGIIVERTRAGLVAAAARGRRGGRPAALDASKTRAAKGYAGVWQHVGNRSGTAAWMRAQHPCIAIRRVVAPLLPRAHDGGSMSVCILVGVPQSLVGRKHL